MTLFPTENTLRPLREHQQHGLNLLREALRSGEKRVVFGAPCSYGKTLCAAHMFTAALSRGYRPLFAVPALTLVDQAVRDFENEGITSIGVIQGNHPRTNPYAALQVASIQTLLRRPVPDVNFVIIDECHLGFKGLYALIDDDKWADKTVIGLSGTPGARGMGKHWRKLVTPATVRSLMDGGWMAPYTAYAPADEYEPDMSGVAVVAGEFNEAQTAKVMSERKIVANVVETWLRLGQGLTTFLYGVDCAHAQLLQSQFMAAGIPWGYIDGETEVEERRDQFAKLRTGEIAGIASVATLIVGVDEPVWCIIDAAPTKSRMRQGQKIPRMLRLDPNGKPKHAILLDHAGNTQRLGLVEDFLWETLDDGKPKDKKAKEREETEPPLPKKCKVCHAMYSVRQRKCPKCGAEPERTSTIEHVPGELVALGSKVKGKKGANEVSPVEKQRFYAELLGYAEAHGKKPGWAYYKAKDKFGVFPASKPQPAMPSRETERWIKAETIRWIKGKEAAQKRAESQQVEAVPA